MNSNYNRSTRRSYINHNGEVQKEYIVESSLSESSSRSMDPRNSYLYPQSISKELPKFGKIMAIVSLSLGLIALVFALMPLVASVFVTVFWLLYPLAFISLIAGVVALINHRIWMPIIGITAGFAAIIIAYMCKTLYALAAAESVNSLTNIAKTFIDALVWPF